jgi:hypothetical protein
MLLNGTIPMTPYDDWDEGMVNDGINICLPNNPSHPNLGILVKSKKKAIARTEKYDRGCMCKFS